MNGYGRGEDPGKKEKASVVTRETFGMTLLLFSVILLVIAAIGAYMLGEIGVAITAFLMGVFGYFVYPFLLFCVGLSLRMITGKKFFAGKRVLLTMLVLVSVFLTVHLATSTRFLGEGFGAYMGGCWNAAKVTAKEATGGGVLFGLVVYPLQALLSRVGAYIILSLFMAFTAFLFLRSTPLFAARKERGERAKAGKTPSAKEPAKEPAPAPRPSYDPRYTDPRYTDPRYTDPRYTDPRYTDPRYTDPHYTDPRYTDPRYAAPEAPRAAAPAERGGAYTAPGMPGFDRYTPPMPQTQPTEPMDILYGTDPASSFRNNLIYNRDSAFNSQTRRSSVQPDRPVHTTPRENVSDFPRTYEPPKGRETPAYEPPKYTERYEAQTEAPRAPMPRKVVEQRPQPAPVDLNYTRQPSYKAPDEPRPAAEDDFYGHDVPYEEEYSSAPHIDDVELPAEPEPPVAPEYRADELRRASPSPQPEPPVAPEPRAEELRRASPSPQPEPVKSEPRADAFEREGGSFRAPQQEETSFGDDGMRDSFGSDLSDPFARREIGFGDRGRETFDRGAEPRDFGAEPDDDAGSSRAVEGLSSRAGLFDEDDEEPAPEIFEPRETVLRRREAPPTPIPSAPAPKPRRHVYRPYVRPSLDIFHQYDENVTVSREEIEHNSQTIIDTLAGFRMDVEVVRVAVGPSVTRYDINIPPHISVGSVTKRDKDIAMRLHARDGVNMYSNNEQGYVSVEVPNSVRAIVGLRSILQSEEYLREKPGALMFAIGKDIEGRCVCGNIAKMKHILVAGATGSGKSVCLNAMLISLLCKYSPEELRLILIDPKMVEFAVYDGLPHLMINEIIADSQKAITALNWAIKEMQRRYELFEQKTRSGVVVRDLDEYNEHLTGDEEKLPKIVIVVDELADLMAVAKKDIEERIQRLTQKARAAGIHLVIATQRPSVDVITGVIKGNLPTRIAFRVIQEVDSRTILDESGAQKLLGNGDMLYRGEGMFNSARVQGAFLSSEEVQEILKDIKANNEAYFDPDVADYFNNVQGDDEEDGEPGDDEGEGSANPEYIRALAMVVKLGQASISLIQRKCSIGYNHAGKIIEWMENMGYISPFDGKAKARTTLLTKEEFESKYGPLD